MSAKTEKLIEDIIWASKNSTMKSELIIAYEALHAEIAAMEKVVQAAIELIESHAVLTQPDIKPPEVHERYDKAKLEFYAAVSAYQERKP